MAASLSKQEQTALVRALAEDDAFRERFEKDPADALASLGVSGDVVSSLKSTCLAPKVLASKEVFAGLLKEIDSTPAQAAMSMEVPTIAIR